ncbi:MAG TPA: hypothetical protein VMR52_14340, partial [Dehalococcoidia bacterium]|nr:hypothetical protein [Dehalococcoidia bacterium]
MLRFAFAALLVLAVGLVLVRFDRDSEAGQDNLQGDVDCNNVVNTQDARSILLIAGRLPTDAPCMAEAGDTDCNEVINGGDALIVLLSLADIAFNVAGCPAVGDPLAPPPSDEPTGSPVTSPSPTGSAAPSDTPAASSPATATASLEPTDGTITPSPTPTATTSASPSPTTTCTPGTVGCGWKTGDMNAFTQFQWDSTSAGATILTNNYSTVYPLGVFDVGIVGSGGFSMTFTSAAALLAYLPATGTAGPLTSDLLNETSSSSGEFGGDVVALKLNVDFSDSGVLSGTAAFGDLLLCNLTTTGFNGL